MKHLQPKTKNLLILAGVATFIGLGAAAFSLSSAQKADLTIENIASLVLLYFTVPFLLAFAALFNEKGLKKLVTLTWFAMLAFVIFVMLI